MNAVELTEFKTGQVDAAEKIIEFFEQYSQSTVALKLWNLYQSNVVLSSPHGDVSYVEDFMFYEDLLSLVAHIEQVKLTNCLVHDDLAPSLVEYSLVSLEGMINLIKEAIPVGTIYNLSKKKDEVDLIIVLERSCNKAYIEFENIIELAMLNYPKSTCTVHNYGLLNSLIAGGHLFYAAACIEDNVVYRKSSAEIFGTVSRDKMLETVAAAQDRFEKGSKFLQWREYLPCFWHGRNGYFYATSSLRTHL